MALFKFDEVWWRLYDTATWQPITGILYERDGPVYYAKNMVTFLGCDVTKFDGATHEERTRQAIVEVGGLLSSCGNIVSWRDHHEGNRLGATVAFSSEEGALRALSKDGAVLLGGILRIKPRFFKVDSYVRRVPVRFRLPAHIRARDRALEVKKLVRDSLGISGLLPVERIAIRKGVAPSWVEFDPSIHPVPRIAGNPL